MKLSKFNASTTSSMSWDGETPGTGGMPIKSQATSTSLAQYTAATAPGSIGYANQAVYLLATIAPAGNVVVDLTNATNVINMPANFAHYKALRVRLLSEGQTALDGVTVGKRAVSVTLSGLVVFKVLNGNGLVYGGQNTVGEPPTAPLTITNDDPVEEAVVEVIIFGEEV